MVGMMPNADHIHEVAKMPTEMYTLVFQRLEFMVFNIVIVCLLQCFLQIANMATTILPNCFRSNRVGQELQLPTQHGLLAELHNVKR